MEPKNPDDKTDSLSWLGEAMTQTAQDGVAAIAHLFAAFYCQLTADGVPVEVAAQLTETFMIAQLERGQS